MGRVVHTRDTCKLEEGSRHVFRLVRLQSLSCVIIFLTLSCIAQFQFNTVPGDPITEDVPVLSKALQHSGWRSYFPTRPSSFYESKRDMCIHLNVSSVTLAILSS